MEILSRKVQDNVLMAEIKIMPNEFKAALNEAYLNNTEHFVVPGYAAGLAPREEIERLYGKDALWDNALDICIPEMYKKYLEQENVSIIGRPKLEKIHPTCDEGVAFTAEAEIYPQVKLGEYKGLRVPLKRENEEAFSMAVLKKACDNMEGDASDTMIERKLDALMAREKLHVNGDSIYHLLADVVEVLVGAYKETGVTRPGAQVRSEALDILLQTVSSDNNEPSREYLKEQMADLVGRYRPISDDFRETLKKLFAKRDEKKKEMTPEEGAKEAFEAYLGTIGLNEEKWRSERREEAASSARCDLLLDAVAGKENLVAEKGDVEEVVDKIAVQCAMDSEEVLEKIDLEPVRNQIMRDKAFKLLTDSAIGEGEV